jgi:excisionase family DNA binding protein
MQSINGTKSMFTSRELARLLNVHINTVRRWSNQGMLQSFRIGTRGDRRFNRDEVIKFLTEHMHQP